MMILLLLSVIILHPQTCSLTVELVKPSQVIQ